MNDNGVSTNALLYMNLLDSLCRHGHSSLLAEVCFPSYYLFFVDCIVHPTPILWPILWPSLNSLSSFCVHLVFVCHISGPE